MRDVHLSIIFEIAQALGIDFATLVNGMRRDAGGLAKEHGLSAAEQVWLQDVVRLILNRPEVDADEVSNS